jgi:hypothetical protein
VRKLLELGCSVDDESNRARRGGTPFLAACHAEAGTAELVGAFVEAGADLAARVLSSAQSCSRHLIRGAGGWQR